MFSTSAAEELRGKQGWIIAEGEATGHHHRIRTRGVKVIRRGPRRFVHVPKGKVALFTHEEHETLRVPEGLHEIGHQVEYQPDLTPRRVYD